MNVLLWILQILLAALFLFSGGIKLVIPADQLQAQAPPTAVHFSAWFLQFIGVCEVLGGLGLVLPGLTRVRKGLTVLAALGLAIIMIGAIVTGIMGEGVKAAIVPFVTGLLCVFVAYGRRNWLTKE
ncbi:MAG TPA: DoxX family protein [Pyrinomonadaceae bacterium]|nr:DoxX family protein [Pyrinomonadaceae bacterium]